MEINTDGEKDYKLIGVIISHQVGYDVGNCGGRLEDVVLSLYYNKSDWDAPANWIISQIIDW